MQMTIEITKLDGSVVTETVVAECPWCFELIGTWKDAEQHAAVCHTIKAIYEQWPISHHLC